MGGSAGDALVEQAKELANISDDPQIVKIAAAEKPSVGDGLDVMLNLLYQADGYRKVIELAGQLTTSPISKSGEYWFYLAAAFGQQHLALRTRSASEQELASTRDNALDAARRAVAADRSFVGRLWAISDPESSDNDLSDFREDPEFRRIIRRPLKRHSA